MTGIEKIIEHIEADADAERAAIIAEAEARCAELGAQYVLAEQSEYHRIISDGEKMAAQQKEHRASLAALEAKKQLLATKQELVQAAFERAAVLLSELPEDRYVALLARLASEAALTGSEQLAFSERDVSRVGKSVRDAANDRLQRAGKTANLTVSDDTRKIRGGVIVICGDIETNCSVDALVGQQRSALSAKVSETLFG